MNGQQFDPISVVEAAYRFDAELDDWLEVVSTRIATYFPDDVPIIANALKADGPDDIRTLHTHRFYPDPEMPRVGFDEEVLERLPDMFAEGYANGPSGLVTTSDLLGQDPREHPAFAPEISHVPYFGDFAAILTREPSGIVIDIGAVVPEVYDVTPEEQSLWNRISAHITTGLRLNLAVGELQPDSADAVLDPCGNIEHVGGEREKSAAVRDALRTAAVNIEHARSDLRTEDSRQALDLWKGLVEGTYSLVDYFDSDGRRFYIARRNDPDVDGPKALSRREQQVVAYAALGRDNRQIAYEMGLAPSTVATYLQRAQQKLGLDSRVDLVQFVRQAVGPDESGES